jgi:dienelactone hydrolase
LLNHRGVFEKHDIRSAIDAWVNDPWLTLPINRAARAALRAGLTRHPETLSWDGPNSRPPPREAVGHLEEIRVPTLLVVGAGDIPDVHAHVGVVAAGIRGAERVVIDSAGHLVHLERSAAFNRLVLAFLRPAEEARAWVDATASDAMARRGADLLRYDPSLPLGVEEKGVETKGSSRVRDLVYTSPKGGPVPTYLVEPTTAGPHAGIVFVHHGQGNRKTFLDEAVQLAGRGVVSVLIDAPEMRPGAAAPGRRAWDRVIDLRERIQGIVDVRRAFDLLIARPDVDPKRLAYVGYSLGATLGGTLAGVEPRPLGFVLMAGFPSLTHTHSAEHFAPLSMAFQALLPPAEQRAWVAAMEPIDGIHQLRVSRASFLFQFAARDEYISRFAAEAFPAAVRGPQVTQWYDTDHFGLGDQSRAARLGWLATLLSLPD